MDVIGFNLKMQKAILFNWPPVSPGGHLEEHNFSQICPSLSFQQNQTKPITIQKMLENRPEDALDLLVLTV